MEFKVLGKARYEYIVEAENEDDAIDRALEQFEDDVSDVLEWEATEIESGHQST